MPGIPFSIRRSGRYYFRRRVRLHDGKGINVIMPPSTCGRQEARESATNLATHFEKLAATGHVELDIEFVACDIDRYCCKDTVSDDSIALIAKGLGVEPTDDVKSAFDQEEVLLAKRRPNGEPLTVAPPTCRAASTQTAACLRQQCPRLRLPTMWPRLRRTHHSNTGKQQWRQFLPVRPFGAKDIC